MARLPQTPIVAVWDVGLTAEEVDVAVEMMRATGLSTPSVLIHAALYHFAKHLQLDIPIDTFHIGRRPPRPAARKES